MIRMNFEQKMLKISCLFQNLDDISEKREDKDLKLDIKHDIQCAFVEICNQVISSVSRTRQAENWNCLLQFYRLCLKYLNLNSTEHDRLIVFLNQIEDYHESYAHEYFVLEKNGISDDHYIRSLKVGFNHMIFHHKNLYHLDNH